LLGRTFIATVMMLAVLSVTLLVGYCITEGSLSGGVIRMKEAIGLDWLGRNRSMIVSNVIGLRGPWPARDLRPGLAGTEVAETPAGRPGIFSYNSWGLRDKERPTVCPPSEDWAIFLGDSYLEGGLCSYPIPALVEQKLQSKGYRRAQCPNLGISNTDPDQYHHRLLNVGLKLKPNMVCYFFFSGNDFMNRPFSLESQPPPSVTPTDPEQDALWHGMKDLADQPYDAGVETLIEMVRNDVARTDSVDLSTEEVREVICRRGVQWWEATRSRSYDRECLQPWTFTMLMRWELIKPPPPNPRPNWALVQDQTKRTVTWIQAAHDACKKESIEFIVFLCPVGTVDPRFVEFWKPYPRSYAQNAARDILHCEIAHSLSLSSIPTVDLAADLRGVPGTYHVTDCHWNETGHELVSNVVSERLVPYFARWEDGAKGR